MASEQVGEGGSGAVATAPYSGFGVPRVKVTRSKYTNHVARNNQEFLYYNSQSKLVTPHRRKQSQMEVWFSWGNWEPIATAKDKEQSLGTVALSVNFSFSLLKKAEV